MQDPGGTETLAQRLIECAPIVVMQIDGAGQIVWINDAAERLFGVRPDEVIGTNILDHLDLEWNPLAVESIGAALEGEGLRRPMLFKARRSDGTTFVAEVTANSQMADPVIQGLAVYVRRWDERILLDEVLDALASNEPLERVLELLVAVMAAETLEADGAILYDPVGESFQSIVASPSLDEVLSGERPSRSSDDTPWMQAVRAGEVRVIPVDDLAPALRERAERAGYRCCWACPVPGPTPGDVAASLVVWRREEEPPDHTCLLALTRIVRLTELVLERNRADRRLRFAATHDPLTGLPNRALFFDRLQDLLEDHDRGPLVGVLYIDLDGFKPVNDRLGHGAGDIVLAEVGHRIAGAVRAGELVARLGGDEFAVVCPDVASSDDMHALAERLVASISAPIHIADEELSVGASIGISLAAPGACSIDVLVDAADSALYEVKSGDKGGWHLSAVFHNPS